MDKDQNFAVPEDLGSCLDEEQVIKEFSQQQNQYNRSSIYVS